MNTWGPQLGSSMPTATQPFGYPMNFPPMQGNIPQQNNQMQQAPAVSALTNKIIVDSVEDVKNYYVAPGGDMLFLHRTEPILFRKVVDNKGTVSIKSFDVIEREEETSFVSKQEFKSLQQEISELKSLLTKNTENKAVGGNDESTIK